MIKQRPREQSRYRIKLSRIMLDTLVLQNSSHTELSSNYTGSSLRLLRRRTLRARRWSGSLPPSTTVGSRRQPRELLSLGSWRSSCIYSLEAWSARSTCFVWASAHSSGRYVISQSPVTRLGGTGQELRDNPSHMSQTEAAKSSLLLLSTKLILLSSSSPPPFLRQVHILHAYVTALGRYDASWAIRDLTRFYVALVKEAGIEVQAEDEGNAVEEEAFARGDFVAGNAAAHDENASLGGESGDAVGRELRRKEAVADQERTRAALRTVLLSGPLKQTKDARSVTEREEDGTRRTLASEQLLGTFALSARFGKSTVATTAPAMGGDAAEVVPVLSGWSPLPGWAVSSSPSALRDPPADVDDDGGGTRSSSTSFTNAPFSKTSRSKARSARDAVQRSASPRLREQVVLVPTESDPSAYARQEVPRTKGLQEFLESESEDGEEDDEGTEEEDESDSESESEEEEVDCGQPRKPAAVGLAAKEKEDDDDDDESESSSEEDDEEMQSDAAVMPAAGQKQPLLASQ